MNTMKARSSTYIPTRISEEEDFPTVVKKVKLNLDLVSLSMSSLRSDIEKMIGDIQASFPAPSVDEAVALAPDSATRNLVQPTNAAYPVLILRGATSQSARLLDIQNSVGDSLAYFEASGQLVVSRSAPGTTVICRVENSSTSANSHATMRIRSASASGDVGIVFDANGVYRTIVVDNDANDHMYIMSGESIAGGGTVLQSWNFSSTQVGLCNTVIQQGTTTSTVLDVNHVTSSTGGVVINLSGNNSSGDLRITYNFNGGATVWSHGVDATDSAFVLSESNALGTSNRFKLDVGGRSLISIGASTSFAALLGSSTQNTTMVGNVGAGEDDLMTYSVPASALGTNGQSVRFKCAGTFAAATVRIRAYFGIDTLFDTGSISPGSTGSWELEVEIVRTGAATQKAIARWTSSSSALPVTVTYTTPTRTLSSANTFKVTGEATADNDITEEFMIGEWRNAA